MGCRKTGRSSLSVVLVLGFSASAGAEPSRFELDYVADSECVSEQGFRALVEQQLSDYDRDVLADAHANVVARFARSEQGYAARFELTRKNGVHSCRELSAPTCAEAAPALAFVLAMALGGRDIEEQTAPDAEQPAATPPLSPPSIPSRVMEPLSPPAPPSRSTRLGAGFGGALGVRSGVGSTLAATESAFAQRCGVRRVHARARGERVRGKPDGGARLRRDDR
jgi:hypothetical protein